MIIGTFSFLSLFANAQVASLIHFNGWEFAEWGTSKQSIINTLNKIGIKNDSVSSYNNSFTITRLDFEEMRTELYFDSLNRFNKVTQHKDYSVIYDKEAKAFYEKTRKTFIQKYGKPDKEKKDRRKEIITLNWNLKFTDIELRYDYKYKIIDEFGCCSYRIDTEFRPK